MSITMNDVKHMDCEICGKRMNWQRMNWVRSNDTEVLVYCDEVDHPEYRFDLEVE